MGRYPKQDYQVCYVTPENNQDARELAEMLSEFGATGMSLDGRETIATWPDETHEQAFEEACAEEGK